MPALSALPPVAESKSTLFIKKHINNIYIYIFIFILSRIAFHFAGISFDVSYLDIDWHSIDRKLIQQNLFESLLYLHSHAPLFNAVTGGIVKLMPDHYPAIFNFSYIILGIIQVILLYRIAIYINLSAWATLLMMVYYCLSPSVIFYENWFFYDYPVSIMITGCCYLYLRYINNNNNITLFYLFFLLSLLLITRSFFNIVILMIVIYIIISKSNSWITIVKIAALPLCLVLCVMGKNMYQFGRFSTSTWLGMNVSRIALRNVPIEEAIQNHQISPICRFPPFSPVERYQPLLTQRDHRYDKIEILSATHKSNDSINYNHIDYIQVADTFKKASIWAIKTYPANYIKNILYATAIYFTPEFSYNTKFIKNSYIDLYCNFVSTNFYQLSKPETTSVRRYFGAMIINILFYIFIAIQSIRLVLTNKISKNQKTFILFSILCISYISIIGNTLEFGENMRFKFQHLPISIILFFLVIDCTLRRRGALAGPPTNTPVIAPQTG